MNPMHQSQALLVLVVTNKFNSTCYEKSTLFQEATGMNVVNINWDCLEVPSAE